MNDDQLFQLWLTIISIAFAGLGTVVWYFILKVIDMPSTYATKTDLDKASDGWKDEARLMREEHRQDNRDTQAKLDRIGDIVTDVHRRIDASLIQRGRNDV